MNLEHELATAIAAARAAGEAVHALRIGDEGVRYGRKDGWELVSEADVRAGDILRTAITTAFPADGWLSEEDADTGERLTRDRVWITDPIDGTREYLMGVPEYAVSLGLCVRGEPVLGVVYNPARDDLAAAVVPTSVEDQQRTLPPEPTVLVGRQELGYRDLPPLAAGTRVAGVGSVAYRLALIARGTGDAVATAYARSEWDVAAGIALCRAAGLRATGILGDDLQFNQPLPSVRGLLVAPPALHERMLAHIRAAISEDEEW